MPESSAARPGRRGDVRVGTSGWVYPHWRGLFYPEKLAQRRWLGWYSAVFDTVEINNSFYRLPSAAAFETWREQAPEGFLYAVKASRFLTHMKKLKDPESSIQLLFERIRGLGNRLGPILYQLPPRWRLDLARFEVFLAALPQTFVHAIEFREPSWLTERVFQLMQRYGVAHCIHDMGYIGVPIRLTARASYVRFHGGRSHSGSYEDHVLKQWAHIIETWATDGIDVYAYFNNDVGGHAITNAATLKRFLAARC
jgi:uncharacterized protein YecE (DUF72 family)